MATNDHVAYDDVVDDLWGSPAQDDSDDGQLAGTPSSERVVGGDANEGTNRDRTDIIAALDSGFKASDDDVADRIRSWREGRTLQGYRDATLPLAVDGVPMALRAIDRWTLWRFEDDGKAKPRKVPVRSNGMRGSSTDPTAWTSFDDAVASLALGVDGIGFVFTDDDDIVGVDLDGCRDPVTGAIAPWARADLDALGSSWAEVSCTGTGVHVFARGRLASGCGHKTKDGRREAYGTERYFTVTGRTLDGAPNDVRVLPDLTTWHAVHFATVAPKPTSGSLLVDVYQPPTLKPSNRPDRVERARQWADNAAPAVEGQGGSDDAMRVAGGVVRGFDLNDGEGVDALAGWNKGCLPPWSPAELARKVAEVQKTPDPQGRGRGWLLRACGSWSRGSGDSRHRRASGGVGEGEADDKGEAMPMPPLKDGTPDNVREAIRLARFTKTWRDLPDPMPMAPIPKAPTFPLDVLPRGVADFCADQARALGVAVEMVAVPVLVVLAGAIGRGVRLRLREGFNTRACLWGMVIAPPGGTKTPALKAATRPLVDAEGVRAAPLREARAKWLARKKEADAVEKGHLRAVSDAAAKGTAPPDRPSEADPPPEPPTEHIVVNDVTVEKLADLMGTSRGLTLFADELASWLHSFTKYRSDGGSDAPFFLTAYSGGTHKVQRQSREDRVVEDAYLNVLGGIQPVKAQSLLTAGDDGLFERFGLIAYPDHVAGTWTEPTDLNPTMRDRFERIIGDLLAKEWGPVVSASMMRRTKLGVGA